MFKRMSSVFSYQEKSGKLVNARDAVLSAFLIFFLILVFTGTAGASGKVFSVSATSSAPESKPVFLIDGNPDTVWKPLASDETFEGFTVRFTEPADITSLELIAPGKKPAPFYYLVNGTVYGKIIPNQPLKGLELKSVGELEFLLCPGASDTAVSDIRINYSTNASLSMKMPGFIAGAVKVTGSAVQNGTPDSFTDCDFNTSWSSTYSSQEFAPVIEISLETNLYITGLYTVNGNQQSESAFLSGGKIKTFDIIADGLHAGSFTLSDKPGIQKIKLDKPLLGKSIKIKVTSVYGKDMMKTAVLSGLAFDSSGTILLVSPSKPEKQSYIVKKSLPPQMPGFVSKLLVFKYISLSNTNQTVQLKFRPDGTFTALSEIYGYQFAKNSYMKGNWKIEKTISGGWQIGLNGKIWKNCEKFACSAFSENVDLLSGSESFSETVKIYQAGKAPVVVMKPKKAVITNSSLKTNILTVSETNLHILSAVHVHPLKKTNIQVTVKSSTNIQKVQTFLEKDLLSDSPAFPDVRLTFDTNFTLPAVIDAEEIMNWYLSTQKKEYWKIDGKIIWGIYPAVISELDYLEEFQLGEALDLDLLKP